MLLARRTDINVSPPRPTKAISNRPSTFVTACPPTSPGRRKPGCREQSNRRCRRTGGSDSRSRYVLFFSALTCLCLSNSYLRSNTFNVSTAQTYHVRDTPPTHHPHTTLTSPHPVPPRQPYVICIRNERRTPQVGPAIRASPASVRGHPRRLLPLSVHCHLRCFSGPVHATGSIVASQADGKVEETDRTRL